MINSQILFHSAVARKKTVADIYLNIGHFLDHFMMLIFAKAAYDAGRFFGLSYDEMIPFGVGGMVLFGAVAPVAAWLADRFSRIQMMIIYHFGLGGSALLLAFSQTPLALAFGLALLGSFAAIYHPVGITMLLQRPGALGVRIGINGVWGNMGVAAAPVMTGVILFYSDWRSAFILSGLMCILFGMVFLSALRDNIYLPAETPKKGTAGFAPHWQRALLALGLTTVAGGIIFGSMTFLIPRYFELSLVGISSDVAITGLLAGIVYAVASFAQVGAGVMVDRISPRLVLLSMACGQMVFIYLAVSYSDWLHFWLMLAAMMFVFGQIPITDAVMARFVPDEWRPKILSIKFMLNLGVGALVLPVSGILLQFGYGFSFILSILAGLAGLICVAALILPDAKGQNER